MRLGIVAIFLALLSSSPTSARGNFWTGNDLYRWCEESEDLALAYVAGAVDSEMLTGEISHGAWQKFCPHQNVSTGQARDIVCKYLAENPADRHLTASYSVSMALNGEFPCR